MGIGNYKRKQQMRLLNKVGMFLAPEQQKEIYSKAIREGAESNLKSKIKKHPDFTDAQIINCAMDEITADLEFMKILGSAHITTDMLRGIVGEVLEKIRGAK